MSDGEDPDDGDPAAEWDVDEILPPDAEVPGPTEDGAEVPGPTEDDVEVPGPTEDGADDDEPPLEGLAEAARERRHADGDDDLMDAFDEVEVEDVDQEALWEQLEDDRFESTVDEPKDSTERDVQVISKRNYCMRCQYFSAPPEVRCTHERGEIREVVDSQQFEVADCPILRGEEELENLRR
jgi:hypothetical protein